MKKIVSIIFAGVLTHASHAQIYSYQVTGGQGNRLGWFVQNNGATRLYGDSIFLRDPTWIDNATTADGTAAVAREIASGDWTFYLNNNMKGRILEITTWDTDYSGNTTTIVAKDDPTISSITGYSRDQSRSARRVDANAIITWHRDSNAGRHMSKYVFDEGNYFGGAGYSGMFSQYGSSITVNGASFVGGDGERGNSPADGMYVSGNIGSILINNETGKDSDRFQAGGYTTEAYTRSGSSGQYNVSYDYTGGSGLGASSISGSVTVNGGDFYGSAKGDLDRGVTYTLPDTFGLQITANGGSGINLDTVGGTTIQEGNFYAGDSSYVIVGGPSAWAISSGGNGATLFSTGTTTINGGNFYGGKGNLARVQAGVLYVAETLEVIPASDADGYANAKGGSGLHIQSATATISGVHAEGNNGGSAIAYDETSVAEASGGSGLFAAENTVNIKSGTFIGGDGGSATTDGFGNAYGGAGAYMSSGTLNITGGEFTGGAGGRLNGVVQIGDIGVMAYDSTVSISDADTNTTINGHIYFENTTAKNLSITGGSIGGDIYKTGAGLVNLVVSSNATYSGSFLQLEGDSAVTLGSADEGKFFTDVQITDGNMTFTGAKVMIADNAKFTLGGTGNTLNFGAAGAELGQGASIAAGYNGVTTAGDLDLGSRSSISFGFDSLTGVAGSLNVGGTLYATNDNAKIIAQGISATPDGTFQAVTATGVELGANDANDLIVVDFGWLTHVDTNATDLTGGIAVGYEYNSLTNTTLSDLGNVLTNVDAAIVGTSTTNFYNLNSLGEENGDELFRYSLSQLPDVSETSFQVSQQVNEQIAARGSEFRSMNGFASTKPKFGMNAPTGVAGPNKLDKEKTMQGWIRAYGSKGSKDADGNFSKYDTSAWGSVIGIDKSFGNLLVGLSGGYARADLDAGQAYQADVDTYHGSIYGTFGNESLFIDLALTYGWSSTDEENDISDASFDSQLASAYLGAGYAFNIGEKLAITPEATLLASYYMQDDYERTMGALGNGSVEEYDTSSYLGSIGVNLATQHQFDWLNRGIAYIPEVRAHYIREFNADPDDFTYIIGGTPTPFAVRSRDENLLRLGFGFDMWSWKYQNTKFEIDYDALLSDTYFESTLSGKITWRF